MTNYSVYVGEKDCGFIIADSLYEAEQRAYELYQTKEEVTVSFLECPIESNIYN